MKRILLVLTGVLIGAVLFCSCFDETCTSGYLGVIKIDGKKADKISIKYIGPQKRNYELEFMFNFIENELPYYKYFLANSICSSKDFRNNRHNFLEIKNLSSESVYICAVLDGAEIDRHPNYVLYASLLDIYGKQDKDPNYDYTKDTQYENIKKNYLDRYEFYEQLLKENYPYIIKLEPQKTCIMKWDNLGFKVL